MSTEYKEKLDSWCSTNKDTIMNDVVALFKDNLEEDFDEYPEYSTCIKYTLINKGEEFQSVKEILEGVSSSEVDLTVANAAGNSFGERDIAVVIKAPGNNEFLIPYAFTDGKYDDKLSHERSNDFAKKLNKYVLEERARNLIDKKM